MKKLTEQQKYYKKYYQKHKAEYKIRLKTYKRLPRVKARRKSQYEIKKQSPEYKSYRRKYMKARRAKQRLEKK